MIADAINEAVDGVMEKRLRERDQREQVVEALMTGFGALRKKPVDDLPERLKRIEEKARRMSESVSLSFVNGRLVVKVAGSSESFMTELRRGSDWYEPWEKVDEVVFAAILVDPSSS